MGIGGRGLHRADSLREGTTGDRGWFGPDAGRTSPCFNHCQDVVAVAQDTVLVGRWRSGSYDLDSLLTLHQAAEDADRPSRLL